MKKILVVLIVTVLGLLFCTCNKPSSEPDTYEGTDFYPLQKGSYVEYDVQKITFNLLGKIDTINYQLKEVVGDTVRSPNNQVPVATKILRYSRINSLNEWHLDSAWYVWTNLKTLVKNENGEEFVKLSFPIKNNIKWNGNIYNIRESNVYEIKNLGLNTVINNKFYEKTVVVMQSDSLPLNIINRDFRVEYYAKNIGLIYKEYHFLIYDQEQLGNYKIETGVKYCQKILSYGKE